MGHHQNAIHPLATDDRYSLSVAQATFQTYSRRIQNTFEIAGTVHCREYPDITMSDLIRVDTIIPFSLTPGSANVGVAKWASYWGCNPSGTYAIDASPWQCAVLNGSAFETACENFGTRDVMFSDPWATSVPDFLMPAVPADIRNYEFVAPTRSCFSGNVRLIIPGDEATTTSLSTYFNNTQTLIFKSSLYSLWDNTWGMFTGGNNFTCDHITGYGSPSTFDFKAQHPAYGFSGELDIAGGSIVTDLGCVTANSFKLAWNNKGVNLPSITEELMYLHLRGYLGKIRCTASFSN